MDRARLIVSCALVSALCGCASGTASNNGLTSKTPAQIVAAARAAATSAATVHVAGSILARPTPISLNMELVSRKGGQGRIVLEGLAIGLVNVDNSLYIKSSPAFYARFAGASAARRLRGWWLKGSAHGEALGALTALASLPSFMAQTLSAHGSLTRAPNAELAGQTVIAVRDSSLGGTLYVASKGTPYPLEIVERGARHGTLVFNKWNQPVSLEPPAHAVNVKQLESR